MLLLSEPYIPGGVSSVMRERYVKSDGSKKILYADDKNLYDNSMSEPLPYDEIKLDLIVEY